MSRVQSQPRRQGLIGGLIGMVGTGVGAAAEYREHRKQRKASQPRTPADSPLEDEGSTVAGPSRPTATHQDTPNEAAAGHPDDLPPAYSPSNSNAHDNESARILASGGKTQGDKKVASHHGDYDYESDSDTASSLSIEADEEAWELDEAAAATEPPAYETTITETPSAEALVHDTLTDRKQGQILAPLPLPVIIPQRRPRNKSRGFVRAYSPVLENVGIDQPTFLKFLKNFHKASQASPWFNAITVAAGIVGFVPEVTAMAVSISVQVVAGVAKEIDSLRKTNKFLDRINDELFKPAGCFAFIIKYKSDAEVAKSADGLLARLGVGSEAVDFSSAKAVVNYDCSLAASPGTGSLAAKMKKIRLVSGETRGSVSMPEAAPLIFPEIDNAIYSGKSGEETFKDKMKDASGFLADYMDRRAQVKYVQEDPESALAVPESKRMMHSKLADPDHPMFRGGLVGLVSGGKIDASSRRSERRADRFERDVARHDRRVDRRERKDEKREERGWGADRMDRRSMRNERREDKFDRKMDRRYGSRLGDEVRSESLSRGSSAEVGRPSGSRQSSDYFSRGARAGEVGAGRGRGNRQNKGVIAAVKKVLQEDVLYLMIVPMPSETELAEARQALEMAQARK